METADGILAPVALAVASVEAFVLVSLKSRALANFPPDFGLFVYE